MFRLASLLSVVCATVGSAQLCTGEPSFGGAPLHFFGGGAVNGYFEFYNAGLLLGNTNVFGELGAGMWTYNTVDGESFVVSGTFGAELPRIQKSKAQICPFASIMIVNGPQNIQGSGFDYHDTDLSIGVNAGYAMAHIGPVQFVPTTSITAMHSTASITDPAGAKDSRDELFGYVGLGLGLRFGPEASLNPSVALPLGKAAGHTQFRFRFALRLKNA